MFDIMKILNIGSTAQWIEWFPKRTSTCRGFESDLGRRIENDNDNDNQKNENDDDNQKKNSPNCQPYKVCVLPDPLNGFGDRLLPNFPSIAQWASRISFI